MRFLFAVVTCFVFIHRAVAAAPDDAWRVLTPSTGPAPRPYVEGDDDFARKVFAGYQGWFNTPDDGANRGWRHWGRGGLAPGNITVDLWPDVSELTDDEKIPTPFRHADGSVAHVFSSHHPRTVERHFDWMKQYGIDGVFVQRFATESREPAHFNRVLQSCRDGAEKYGRTYSVMYDLSGLKKGETTQVIADWKKLIDTAHLTRDAAYQTYRGKPLVTIWGIGFNDGRGYTLDECKRLVDFFRHDHVYGGNAVMLGVPTYWRTLDRDTVKDPALHDVIARADLVSPWAVGRFGTPEAAAAYGADQLAGDIAWCRERKLTLLPVIFPGFSWHNLNPKSPTNQIPRRGGAFLWAQAVAAKKAGASSVYVAMFDEVDEGTAIFKVTNDPPVGETKFANERDVKPDHYLWLTGRIGALLRGEIEEPMPKRE